MKTRKQLLAFLVLATFISTPAYALRQPATVNSQAVLVSLRSELRSAATLVTAFPWSEVQDQEIGLNLKVEEEQIQGLPGLGNFKLYVAGINFQRGDRATETLRAFLLEGLKSEQTSLTQFFREFSDEKEQATVPLLTPRQQREIFRELEPTLRGNRNDFDRILERLTGVKPVPVRVPLTQIIFFAGDVTAQIGEKTFPLSAAVPFVVFEEGVLAVNLGFSQSEQVGVRRNVAGAITLAAMTPLPRSEVRETAALNVFDLKQGASANLPAIPEANL